MKDWKLTWGYVPITYDTELGKLEDMTQHVIIPNNLDGDKIKLKFSNIGNDCPLAMERVTFCTRNCFTGILTEGITVTKAGKSEITLGPNEEFWSDEIEVSVTHMDLLEIFTYFKESSVVKTACVTWCEDAWTSNLYRGDCRSGEQLSDKDILPYLGNDPYQNHALFGFSRIAVLTDSDVITLGVYGDSITHMSFYSGPLTQMLHRRKPGKISVVNGGIAGNRVTEDAPFADFLPGKGKQFGEAGTRRIERDMLLEYPPDIFFCMEGVNDCTHCFAFNEDKITTGEDIFAGIQSILSKAKTAGCRTIVSTIAPFGCYQESFREPAEAIRQSVNEKLRSSNLADEIIDLDKLLRKEDDIHFMKDELHFGDGVHPNIKGGRVIAKALLPIVLGEELDFREEEVTV